MADDYIRRQDAVKTSLEFIVEYLGGAFDEGLQKELKNNLESIEPADVVEVKHGEWMSAPETWGVFDIRYYCSECGKDAIINNSERYVLSDYCPHCGAIMDEKKRGGQ